MSGKYVTPSIVKSAFSCPLCGTLCRHDRYSIFRNDLSRNAATKYKLLVKDLEDVMLDGFEFVPADVLFGIWDLDISICYECGGYVLWHQKDIVFPHFDSVEGVPDPIDGMPDDVYSLYNEASLVYLDSKRSSAALLRLSIETLLVNHLNVKKDSINNMIGQLIAENSVPSYVQKGLDGLRYYGNKGVHLGEINFDEKEEEVIFMFKLVNKIVDELIVKPQEIDDFYEEIPESFKKQVESRDS